MTKKELIDSAALLTPISKNTSEELSSVQDELVAQINTQMSKRPDLIQLIGDNNLEMMKTNHHNHALYMQSAMHLYNPNNFVQTILWVYRAYRSHGFQMTYWPAQLRLWIDLYETTLSAKALAEIRPFYEWILIHQAVFIELSEKQHEESQNPALA